MSRRLIFTLFAAAVAFVIAATLIAVAAVSAAKQAKKQEQGKKRRSNLIDHLSPQDEHRQKTTKRPHTAYSKGKMKGFAPGQGRIKHVVVLMLENRGFNHMLGYRPGVNGVAPGKPAMCNPISLSDPSKGEICYSNNAQNVPEHFCDPNHDAMPQHIGAFGLAALEHDFSNASMIGWVDKATRYWHGKSKNYCSIMECFSPENLPVINALADNFVLHDQFFSSFTGPTWPQRLFSLTGTSRGLTETSTPWYRNVRGELYPQRNIFDQVADAGLDWKVVINDTTWEGMIDTIANHPENVELLSTFFEKAKTGKLPSFSWINPRAGVNLTTGEGSTDQHPPHQVFHAERFVKQIYEALRASPAWNDTLFVYYYDEQGGFAESFPVPATAPAPDDFSTFPDEWVTFTHGGLRIPALLISPWLPKNMVVSAPPADAMPAPDSVFELTSILALTRSLLGIDEGPLTKRDAWAATQDYLFDLLSEPRTDCPMHLPDALTDARDQELLRTEGDSPLDSLQHHHAMVHAQLSNRDYDPSLLQKDLSARLMQQQAVHSRATLRWKASHTGRRGREFRSAMRRRHMYEKAGLIAKPGQRPLHDLLSAAEKAAIEHRAGLLDEANYVPEHLSAPQMFLRCQSMIQDTNKTMITHNFLVDYPIPADSWVTIASNITYTKKSSNTTASDWYCMTADDAMTEGSTVELAICLPHREPRLNRDKMQWWRFDSPTMTIRPWQNQELCVTNQCVPAGGNATKASTSSILTLQKCSGSYLQVWNYEGPGGGVIFDQKGSINFGDAILSLVVTDNATVY